MKVNDDIIEYVEGWVMPRYAGFDKAHREDHARMVIEQSIKLAEGHPEVNPDMVYVIAAFHDLGLVNGRENHHHNSKKILESDNFIREHFTTEEIKTMGEAVEDHRASNAQPPRSIYGMIVAEADRFIEPETIIRRTVQYGLSNYPELDREGHYQRTIAHLTDKYGYDGYLKIWIPGSDNARKLDELRKIISDTTLLREMFDRIYEEYIELI
ncbi:MAG: HD domain-containing protein [Muribaculaceae bacterium]|nr:HD domain-containing protein [Muribaculaceae bacterium]